jgi:hypothetical protein
VLTTFRINLIFERKQDICLWVSVPVPGSKGTVFSMTQDEVWLILDPFSRFRSQFLLFSRTIRLSAWIFVRVFFPLLFAVCMKPYRCDYLAKSWMELGFRATDAQHTARLMPYFHCNTRISRRHTFVVEQCLFPRQTLLNHLCRFDGPRRSMGRSSIHSSLCPDQAIRSDDAFGWTFTLPLNGFEF